MKWHRTNNALCALRDNSSSGAIAAAKQPNHTGRKAPINQARRSKAGCIASTGIHPLAVVLFHSARSATEKKGNPPTTTRSRLMNKGFGVKGESKTRFIDNFFKHSKKVNSHFETPEEAQAAFGKDWYYTYASTKHRAGKEETLSPDRKELTLERGESLFKIIGDSSVALGAWLGIWRILIHKRPKCNTFDFDISVNTGGRYRFHPEVIRDTISAAHGKEFYSLWREQVLKEIPDLEILINETRKELTTAAWSYTCCESAARLCKRVGLKQKHRTVFLFPDSYQ